MSNGSGEAWLQRAVGQILSLYECRRRPESTPTDIMTKAKIACLNNMIQVPVDKHTAQPDLTFASELQPKFLHLACQLPHRWGLQSKHHLQKRASYDNMTSQQLLHNPTT